MKNESKSNIGEHEKYRYEECYAKILLERVYPEIYTDLSILDKPDLQNEVLQVGVEVTSAVPSSLREAKACWIKAIKTNDAKIKDKYVKRMKQLGYTYTGGVQSWLRDDFDQLDIEHLYEETSLLDLEKSITQKLEKLNGGGFKELKQMDLYVDAMSSLFSINEEDVCKVVKSANVGEKHFRKIIINFMEDNEIVMIDTDEEKYMVNSYDRKQYEYALAALDMIRKEDTE